MFNNEPIFRSPPRLVWQSMFSSFSSSAHCLPTFSEGSTTISCSRGSMFLSKNIAGWFSKLIWVISGIVFTATFFSWETGGADHSSESLQRRILPDRWPLWQFVFYIGRMIWHNSYISINSSWRRKAKEQSMAWSWWTTTRNSTGSTPGWWASRVQILNWTLSLGLGHVVSSINSIYNCIEGSLHKEKWLLLGGSCRPTFLR